MKPLFTFCFALYLLALSVVPCGDVHAKERGSVPAVYQAQSAPVHHSEDHCSPFCICACCQTVVAVMQQEPAAPPVWAPLPTLCWTDAYRSEESAAPASTVWQPPKA